MRASFCSRNGSGDSFQVLVRWKVIFASARIWRSRSREIVDLASLLGRQVAGQLAHAPAGEGLAQAAWTLGGRLDDQLAFLSRYPAGTATRPLRVQGVHPLVVEGMDHLAHPVGAGLDQPGDRRHVVAARRGEHDQRSAPLDDGLVALAAAPTHDPLELPALLVGEPAHLHWSSHRASLRDPPAQVVDAPPRLVVRALAAADLTDSKSTREPPRGW